jgi:hypothetical protein
LEQINISPDYYDKRNEPYFDALFGELYIGKNPTRARTSLLILLLDFSTISGGTYEELKSQFHLHVRLVLRKFLFDNHAFLQPIAWNIRNMADGEADGGELLFNVLVFLSALRVVDFGCLGAGRKPSPEALCGSR